MPITISGSTGIAGVDGSASTPAIQGTDTNTGVTFPAADTVVVSTGGSERMRVDSSGNVGIGTSSPSKKLVVSNSGAAGVELDPFTRSATTGASLLAYNRSTASYARMDYDASEQLFFISGTERARINTSGQFTLGTTINNPGYGNTTTGVSLLPSSAPSCFSGGTDKIVVINTNSILVDLLSWRYAGSQIGSVTTNGSTITYGGTSDYRLKEDVAPIEGALDKIARLNPVSFKWKNTGIKDDGFITHELQEVFPNAVHGEKDAVEQDGSIKAQSVDPRFLIATLTKAIQELNAKVEGLQAEINALKGAA